MGKEEYLQQLEKLLYDIPREDREEALQFYSDYLLDAGEEAGEVLRALGSPQELAESIRKDLYGENQAGDFTRVCKEVPGTYRVTFSKGSRDADRQYSDAEDAFEQETGEKLRITRRKFTTGQWLVFIVLCIAALPVILPLGGALLAVLAALLIAVVAVVFGLGVAGIALLAAGIAVIIAALLKAVFSPMSSLVMLGGGFMLGGFALIGSAVTIWILVKIFPALFHGMTKACTKICAKLFK